MLSTAYLLISKTKVVHLAFIQIYKQLLKQKNKTKGTAWEEFDS